MKCPNCGHDSAALAAFCSRCGSRFVEPLPSVGREDVMMTVRPSWWHLLADFLIALDLVAGGLYL
jgi:predicted amidophosphoribosyltransferase